ncbi:MAG: oligopeptide transport system permease protein AppC [Phycisphaerales bacterium]|nr:oligopeptide transport system permease protein AppC [Phycisphaerales bacterium]
MPDPTIAGQTSATLDPTRPVAPQEPSAEAGALDSRPRFEGPLRIAWRRFRRHRPGLAGLAILVLLYIVVVFADFISPYSFDSEARELLWAPPNVHFVDGNGFSIRPFVHPLRIYTDMATFAEVRDEDQSQRLYLRLFTRGDSHSLLGFVPSTIHLFGVDPISPGLQSHGYFSRVYLMGADNSGRDVFSRLCYGSRISMTIGLIGTFFVLLIGLALGGAMGYFGGRIDDLLYSFSQMVLLLPGFYLLLMLRFAFPSNMGSIKVYFAIILILSIVGWPSFAMVIRGMVQSIMQESYVLAARAVGLGHARIIARHVLPNTTSYVIVTMTLRIPAYILGESALSLLGLGISEPDPSWGNMLHNAMDIVELNQHPWVLWPGVFIFLAVVAFNLVGDGLRDAFDPRRLKT